MFIPSSNNSEQIPLRRAFRYLKPAFIRTRKIILFMGFITIVSGVLGLLPPYLGKQLFDKGVMAGNTSLIVFYGLLTLGAHFLTASIRFGAQALFTIASNRFSLNLKSQILKRLLILPMEFFDKQHSGYLVSRVSEADMVTTLFSPTIFQFIASLIEAVGALVIIINISSQVAWLMLPFMPVFLLLTTWMSNKLRQTTIILRETSAITIGGLQEIVSGVNDIKYYDVEGRKLNEILTQYKNLAAKNIKQSIFMASGTGLLGLLTSVLGVSVMIFIGILITREQLTIGDYIALTGYSMKIFNPVQILGNLLLILQPAIASMKRLGMFFESETEQEIWGKNKTHLLIGKIDFTSVSFGYDGPSDLVLDKCNFSISPGERIVIYGKNGSGKSTILKLILGMYHKYKGIISLDDIDLYEYDIASLRNRIGIVSQNTFLFRGNLMDNILMASPDKSERRLQELMDISGCTSLFGDKLDEIQVEENGKNLSGGQKQVVAIARCLLKNPDVLLFDEATTYLDNTTRKIVLDTFQNTFKDKTRILITHEREIASIADRIFQLEDGHIREFSYSEFIR